jgi:hypothetical protein
MPEEQTENGQQTSENEKQFLADYKMEMPVEQSTAPGINDVVRPGVPISDIYPHSSAVRRGDSNMPVPNAITKAPKKIFSGMMIVFIVVVFLCSSLVGANYFYQQPQKVLADSIVNLVTTRAGVYEAVMDINVPDSKVSGKITITAKQSQTSASGSFSATLALTLDGKAYNVNGSAMMVSNGDLYVKFGGLADVISQAETSLGVALSTNLKTAIDNLIANIDNVWIRLSSDDLKGYSDTLATSKDCLNETLTKYKNDSSAINEIASQYNKHQFVILDNNLGFEGGSFGYDVRVDNSKLKDFMVGFKTTKYYASLHECDSSFTIDTNNMSTKNDTSKVDADNYFHLWVDFLSHRVTKVETSSKNGTSTLKATITPKYDEKVEVTAPKSSISLTQLQQYIGELMNAFSTELSANNAPSLQTQSLSNAYNFQAVVEMYYADNGYYPSLIAYIQPDVPSGISILPDYIPLNSTNGSSTITWGCLNTCINPTGGRIKYYDFNTNTSKYIYVGAANATSTYYVSPNG